MKTVREYIVLGAEDIHGGFATVLVDAAEFHAVNGELPNIEDYFVLGRYINHMALGKIEVSGDASVVDVMTTIYSED